GNEYNTALRVEGHPAPVVGGTAVGPGILGPGVIPEFAGTWNSVKAPAQLSGYNLVSANIAGRSRQNFGIASTNNEKVLINHRRVGQCDGSGGRVPPQIFPKVNAAVIAETRNGPSRGRVDLIHKIHDADDDAVVLTIGARPIREPAVRLGAWNARVELPLHLAGGGVEGKDFLRGRNAVQYPVHFNRAGLQHSDFLCVVAPGNLKLLDVRFVDLGERRVVLIFPGA